VLRLLGEGVKAIEAEGRAEVSIGGRPFVLGKAFVDDVRMQTLKARVAHLGRALLIMHAPLDAVVGIENATEIFLAAKHPKSFVSLDTADHLITKASDAEYAAAVIAAWASRYVGSCAHAPENDTDGAVRIEETGAGKFQVQISAHGSRIFADEPIDVGGLGSGFSPYELVSAGLGACTAMTVRLYASGKGWPLERVRGTVRHEKVAGQKPADIFHRAIAFDGGLDAGQRTRLYEIAEKCPVHRTLEGGARIETSVLGAADPAPDGAAERGAADEHFRDMDETCREAGA
jgi:putative redox protein